MTAVNPATGTPFGDVAPEAAHGRWKRAGAAIRDYFSGSDGRFIRTGVIILVPLVLFAIIAPMLAGPDATSFNALRRLQGPRFFPAGGGLLSLGTDHLGRDLGVITALGLRTSLTIGILSVLLTALIGSVVGAVTGYLGGWVDMAGGRVTDVFDAVPGMLLVIALATVLGPSMITLIVVLALAHWVNYARVVRSRCLALSSMSFIDAARVSNVGAPRMLATHIRWNTMTVIVSLSVIQLPQMILGEAGISFLGFGLQPPDLSLGSIMAAEKDFLQINGWAVTFPGLVLTLLCVGAGFLGLGLRDRSLRLRGAEK